MREIDAITEGIIARYLPRYLASIEHRGEMEYLDNREPLPAELKKWLLADLFEQIRVYEAMHAQHVAEMQAMDDAGQWTCKHCLTNADKLKAMHEMYAEFEKLPVEEQEQSRE